MKKLLSLVLILLMLFSLAACAGETDTSSAPEGQSSDIPTSDTPDSSDISDDDGGDAMKNAAAIEALYAEAVPDKGNYVNILEGLDYTFSRDPYDKYAGTPGLLTDGKEPDLNDNSAWHGFLGKDVIEIYIDLGEKREGLCGFSITAMDDTAEGRGAPRKAELYVSDDGESYVRAVNSGFYFSANPAERSLCTVEGYSERFFAGRYIKLVLDDFRVNWTFLDNFCLYVLDTSGADDDEQPDEYYKNEPLPEVTSDILWDPSEPDYTKEINLILGLGQRFYSMLPIQESYMTSYYNVLPSTTVLTDGRQGIVSYTDPSFAHFTGASGREVVYDIGRLSELHSASFSCMVDEPSAITPPENVKVQLSADGVEWQTVGSVSASDFKQAAGRAKADIKFDKPYAARFVKFAFGIGIHCWVDELSAYGTKRVTSEAARPDGSVEDKDAVVLPNAYPTPDVLGGSENIYLAYNYRTENPAQGLRSKEQFLPLVGYYDTEGKLRDFFFDSFLFLPCSTTCPSGGVLWEAYDRPSFMTDWLDYEDDLYADGYNIKALNEAVGEVKTELGKDDYTAFVYLSIFNLPTSQRNFGDVDGDGIAENASIMSDRKKIAKWWIDRNIANFNAAGLNNLKLNGFYWYDENIGLSDPAKREITDYIVDYVHSLGYYIIWIPYYQASGYSQWQEAGFDCANMQPNYMFNDDATEKRLYDNAELAKLYGMGVEIEADGRAISGTDGRFERYMAYLRVGAETGYMDGVKMYYFDAVPGVLLSAYYSEREKVRTIYDVTYLYAKKQLSTTVEFDESQLKLTAEQNKMTKGKLTAELPIFEAVVKYSARHGLFVINSDGSYKYTPDKDFTGSDSVTVSISAGVAQLTFTIDITVG